VIAEAIAPIPVEYLSTGDHALLMAWTDTPPIFFLGGSITVEAAHMAGEYLKRETQPKALLCLEDGRAVVAPLNEIKFDYRWSEGRQQFVDVSALPTDEKDARDEGEEEDTEGADTDQEPPDDGGTGVPGPVPEAD
jgi:hypothetical protein